MTPQEAIERIYIILKNCEFTRADKKSLITAISALEKQIPKKPVIEEIPATTYTLLDYLCPSCKWRIISKLDEDYFAGSKDMFCSKCGQALDWSE